ncbi:glycerophosphodiester phosphodiesterase [candidate division KSB3 bacterium]|uniref:glycerophosphodiester phosphodiesterase n=1 Tax=candidate division KSB3 bacterium TaxID=2044937 RepID=A0A9D5Q4A7_9BACT|nr:glycerophosphodiester phosphodiesterase [candidate division KSB3 bacterium]MBD3323519.1 glycerophosphodiester phosphodiesterase [candidate division KSB3 bacterium]
MIIVLAAMLWGLGTASSAAEATELGELQEKIVIAHRGASGYLPEHTLEAVALAYGMGADFIEQDLVLTKDGVPLVLHDIHLDTTTNVRKRFPDRARADGRWYVIDFTLEEIKSLDVHERIDVAKNSTVFPGRFPLGHAEFEVPTFVEEIELIQGLNKSMGRNVGIYPELKAPAFHTREGYDMGKIVLDILALYGYKGPNANIYLQCFDHPYLKRLREELGTELPLIQLIGKGRGYDYLVTAEGLNEIATYANGIGPAIERIVHYEPGSPLMITNLVLDAHARGLAVHPYTFRKDSLPAYANTLEELLRMCYFVIGVDGIFTDFPDLAIKLLTAAGYHHAP